MTEPADDATDADDLVEPTGNALQPDDPAEQPSQNPDDLPPGTVSGRQV